MRLSRSIVFAVAVLSFSTALGLCFHVGGSLMVGTHENADSQCQRRVEPPRGVVESEANPPRGQLSFWPLGVSCTWEAKPGEAETVHMFGWSLTIEAISAGLLCMVGGGTTAVLVRSEPRVVTEKRD